MLGLRLLGRRYDAHYKTVDSRNAVHSNTLTRADEKLITVGVVRFGWRQTGDMARYNSRPEDVVACSKADAPSR